MGNPDKLAALEGVIREWDGHLLKKARAIVDMADAGAAWTEIDRLIGDMDIDQQHRRATLSAYSAAGGAVKNAHEYGAFVERGTAS